MLGCRGVFTIEFLSHNSHSFRALVHRFPMIAFMGLKQVGSGSGVTVGGE